MTRPFIYTFLTHSATGRPHTIASSCCASLRAGPTSVCIGIPRSTPAVAASALLAREVEPVRRDELMVGSEVDCVGKVKVEVDGCKVHFRWL